MTASLKNKAMGFLSGNSSCLQYLDGDKAVEAGDNYALDEVTK